MKFFTCLVVLMISSISSTRDISGCFVVISHDLEKAHYLNLFEVSYEKNLISYGDIIENEEVFDKLNIYKKFIKSKVQKSTDGDLIVTAELEDEYDKTSYLIGFVNDDLGKSLYIEFKGMSIQLDKIRINSLDIQNELINIYGFYDFGGGVKENFGVTFSGENNVNVMFFEHVGGSCD